MVREPTRDTELESTALRLAEELLAFPDNERGPRLAVATDHDLPLRHRVEQLLTLEREHGEFPLIVGLPDLVHLDGPPAEPLVQGGQVGAFRIVRLLGRGGMGSVYEAQQDSPRRRVALKALHTELASDETRQRFRNEAEVLALLRHPGIAQVFEAGVHEEVTSTGERPLPYFAMEYVEGARTVTAFAREEHLDTRATLELFLLFCDALQHGHERGVIHRDLKPGNLLVDASGRAKVIDFGVARATSADLAVTAVETQPGRLIGTVQYMSPEQVRGDPAAIDQRADVYGLGVVLYELLCGGLPYEVEGDSLKDWMDAIVHAPPVRPRRRADLGRDLETVLLKALEKERDHRYASVAALADDLRRHLRDEPIAARPASALHRMRLFGRRHSALMAALALVALVVLIATAVSLRFGQQARDSDEVAARRGAEMRTLSQELLFGVFDAIDGLPGATAARAQVVRTSLATLAQLRDEAHDDPQLQRDLVEAYARMGRVQGYPTAPNLGATEAALASYATASELLEGLIRASPEDAELRARRADLLREQASVLREGGQLSRALELLEQALVATRGLPPDLADSGRLVAMLAQTGDARLEVGRPAAGLYEEALSLAERADLPRDEHVLLNKLGDLDLARGDHAAAAARFERSLEIIRELHAAHPEDVRSARDLGSSLGRIGNLRLGQGQSAAALESFEQALGEAERRAVLDSDDATARSDWAMCMTWVGEAQRALRNGPEALSCFEGACDAYAELVAADPGNADVRLEQGVAQISLAEIQRALGRLDAALDTVSLALATLASISTDESAAEARRRRGIALDLRGGLLLDQGRAGEALAAFEQYHEFAAAAALAIPADLGLLRQRMVAEDRLGMAHQALGADARLATLDRLAHLEQAMHWYERTLATFDESTGGGLRQGGDDAARAAIEAELPACEQAMLALEQEL